VAEAKGALAQAVPRSRGHLADESIEIHRALTGISKKMFSLERVTWAWDAKLKRALARGTMDASSGDTFWLADRILKDFCAYGKTA